MSLIEGLNGGGGGGRVHMSAVFYNFLTLSVVGSKFRPLWAVGKSQLIFFSLVGNFFLVLSVVSSIFSPFVASRLTPFTPSLYAILNS